MYKLIEVEVNGFWGKYKLKTNFHDDVNIFIGKNGTGKTTFMNLLQAVLTIDLETLSSLQFESIYVKLKKGKSSRKISVSKIPDKQFGFKGLECKISTNKFVFPILSSDYDFDRYKSGRINPNILKLIEYVRSELNKLIDISFLTVYREVNIEDDYRRRREPIMNSVDLKLTNLMNQLTNYQLKLEAQVSDLSNRFQKNVLKTMLFNSEFDRFPFNKKIELDERKIEEIKLKLQDAFQDLGILDKKTRENIDLHLSAISESVLNINKYVEDNKNPIYTFDIAPLTLFSRTKKIIEFSTKLQEDKLRILKPLDEYLKLLNSFIEGKIFSINRQTRGGLLVNKENDEFNLFNLSSGEKQLIILLTETLLQNRNYTIFIADEPELSLHISWQRKILPSLTSINPNAQIIIATHSPEIVGKWKDKTINMKNITHG